MKQPLDFRLFFDTNSFMIVSRGQHEACQGKHDYLKGLHVFSNTAKTWFSDIILNGNYFLWDLQPGFESNVRHVREYKTI